MIVPSRFWFWWRSRGMPLPFVLPTRALSLADFNRAGLTFVEGNGEPLIALIIAEIPGDSIYQEGQAGQFLEGSLSLDDDTEIARIRIRDSGERIPFSRGPGTSLTDLFDTDGVYPDAILHFQTLDGVTTAPFSNTNSSGTFAHFNPFAEPAILDAVENEDRFIFAISYTMAMVMNQVFWGVDQVLWGIDALQWGV